MKVKSILKRYSNFNSTICIDGKVYAFESLDYLPELLDRKIDRISIKDMSYSEPILSVTTKNKNQDRKPWLYIEYNHYKCPYCGSDVQMTENMKFFIPPCRCPKCGEWFYGQENNNG